MVIGEGGVRKRAGDSSGRAGDAGNSCLTNKATLNVCFVLVLPVVSCVSELLLLLKHELILEHY